MGDATAKGLVKVIGLQWGMLDNYVANPASFDQYNLPIWATEHKCGNYPFQTTPKYVEPAPNDQAYGVESWGYIRNAIKAGVTAYNAWNMVLDVLGKGNDTVRQWSQDALLIVNTSTKTLTLTPAYYVFRHVSQYVQPAAKVVATSGGDAIAFKNPDGSIVAVMYNSGGASNYIVQIAGKKLQFAMPATGWATVVSPVSAMSNLDNSKASVFSALSVSCRLAGSSPEAAAGPAPARKGPAGGSSGSGGSGASGATRQWRIDGPGSGGATGTAGSGAGGQVAGAGGSGGGRGSRRWHRAARRRHGAARAAAARGNPVVHLDQKDQTIQGFGINDMFQSTALPASLFDATNGIGLSILRVGMDTNGAGNLQSATSMAADIATVNAAGGKVIGAVWTPPATCKTNNNANNGGQLCSANNIALASEGANHCTAADNTSCYTSWATTIANFASTNHLYAMSLANEPEFASCGTATSRAMGPIRRRSIPPRRWSTS